MFLLHFCMPLIHSVTNWSISTIMHFSNHCSLALIIGIIGLLGCVFSQISLRQSYYRQGSPYRRRVLIQKEEEAVQNQPTFLTNKLNSISPKYRLNDTWIPSNYQLTIKVILDADDETEQQFTARGSLRIKARPMEVTESITLNANFVQVESVEVVRIVSEEEEVPIGIRRISNDTERHFLTIELDRQVGFEDGEEYAVKIDFLSEIFTDKTNGLYLSTYVDEVTGEERRQAATQMEPVAARQLFPCFDEPGLKATFDVAIIRKENYTSLFNTPILRSEALADGYVRDTYERTPPMPTYLFAMVVSDFAHVERVSTNPSIPIRVHGRKDLISMGRGNYSVETTANVFSQFNSYFSTSYPIEKLDSVAVPLKGGAMENYGLILYREDLLMYSAEMNTEQERYDITDVIAHEVAHQNFGNLVTCKWWSDLWLNEGFATYMSHLGTEWTKPEFRSREKILNEIVQFSMITDAGINSHPLKNDAYTQAEISSIFSDITYKKGGSIVRMIEGFLTEITFQKGLKYYLDEM